MEALTLLGDSELRTLGLPLGPRMKMLSAIEERRKAMSDEQILQDSQLWERIYIFEIKNKRFWLAWLVFRLVFEHFYNQLVLF